MLPPPGLPQWIAVSNLPLPVEAAIEWATTPSTGAVVSFVGVVRDHSDGRPGVVGLSYEAYEGEAVRAMARIAAELRGSWPETERVAMLHRTGDLRVGEASVLAVVSAPHRAAAFEAARWTIDTLKETVPLWKREHWADGSEWSATATSIRAAGGAVQGGPTAGRVAPPA